MYYLFGFALSFFLISGMAFASHQRKFPEIAKRDVGHDAAFSFSWSIVSSFAWPAMLPICFLICQSWVYGFIPIWSWRKQPGWSK